MKRPKIQKNVPPPVKTVFPFESMDVNDSFIAGEFSDELRNRVGSAMNRAMKDNKKVFTQKHCEDGKIRVWRTV